MEVDHLTEEVKGGVAYGSVGKEGHFGTARPGDDANEEDANNHGAPHAVEHQDDGQDSAAEDTNPHGGVTHLVEVRAETSLVARLRVDHLIYGPAAGKL